MRIDKFLSNLKYGTRKEVQSKIKNGHVLVNGKTIKSISHKLNPEIDEVSIEGKTVYYKETIILILNKPSGYLSSHEEGKTKTVYELINEPYNRFDLNIAGRLDKDTEGLLVLTNNGALLHSIISPKKQVFKKYYVKTLKDFDISQFGNKIIIKDGRGRDYIPMKSYATRISPNEFYLEIQEGKFHQVKRMVSYFDNEVIYLKRVAIGDLELPNDLALGEYKEINIDDFKL